MNSRTNAGKAWSPEEAKLAEAIERADVALADNDVQLCVEG